LECSGKGEDKEVEMNSGILRLRAVVLYLVPACIVWTAAVAGASVMRYLSLEDQCDMAKVIVVATATSQSSSWADNSRRIYTDTSFEVKQTVKGEVGGVITVRQLGGQVEDVAQVVAGSPVFVTGESYVLFLDPRPDGKYRVVGFSQGCYPVVTGSEGKARVMPSMAASSGAHFIDGPQGKALSTQSLEEFLGRIRHLLKQNR
jgi:hypothetical protein